MIKDKERCHHKEMDKKRFEGVVDGKEVGLYTLRNKGMEVDILNHGAKIVAIKVPDREGNRVDIVLGHDSLEDYINSEEQYFGAVCGRYANRIAKGKFTIDGEEYTLLVNNGSNALHGGKKGFNDVIWQVEHQSEQELVLSYTSPDGEEGYPGTLRVQVSYALCPVSNNLLISYEATTTKPTVLNLTNHAYFNLSGEGDPSVHDHTLLINAKEYLPTDDTAIPYGKSEAVADTPFDFIAPHLIGERIDTDIDQLRWARGYDHTFIIDKPIGEVGVHAICSSPKTGIEMTIKSDQPGMQLYTGNWMSGNMRGKGDSRYPARAAVCFETQHYPDSPNKPEYPTTVLRPGETFRSQTSFGFGVKE